MRSMTLYAANCRENEKNTYYPTAVTVNGIVSLYRAVQYDHVAGQMENSQRGKGNFITADCVMLDLDNTHSEDPDEWDTLDDIQDAFPDVQFYAVKSRNYMREKQKQNPDGTITYLEAREKWHCYFPVSHNLTQVEYEALAKKAAAVFPHFDHSALDAARFFYGTNPPHGNAISGDQTLDEYLDTLPDVEPETTDEPATAGEDDLTPVGLDWIGTAKQRDQIAWLKRWAEKYKVELGRSYLIKDDKQGHKDAVVFCVECPWKDEHGATEAWNESVIIIDVGGKLDYLCRHNHCAGRGWKAYRGEIESRAPIETKNDKRLHLVKADAIKARETDWLVPGWIPRQGITILGAAGGIGKTTLECQIAADVSAGRQSVLINSPTGGLYDCDPEQVLFLTIEDALEEVNIPRLIRAKANLNNITMIDRGDPLLTKLDFNSDLLRYAIEDSQAKLVIFDPIQQFIPENINMGYRNAMRKCLTPLLNMAKEYDCTFLIVAHCNKRETPVARHALSDSSDIWDIARSVIMMDQTDAEGVVFVSHEKCNTGERQKTVLITLDGGKVNVVGETKNRWAFYHKPTVNHTSPVRDEVSKIILDKLADEERIKVKDLERELQGMGFSHRTLERAKAELKAAKKMQYSKNDFDGEWSIIKGINFSS